MNETRVPSAAPRFSEVLPTLLSLSPFLHLNFFFVFFFFLNTREILIHCNITVSRVMYL